MGRFSAIDIICLVFLAALGALHLRARLSVSKGDGCDNGCSSCPRRRQCGTAQKDLPEGRKDTTQ